MHSAKVAPTSRTTSPDTHNASPSTPIAPTSTTTASVPGCVASELTMAARPQATSYDWNETLEVTVQLSIRSEPPCQLVPDMFSPGDPSEGCFPEVILEYYDATLSPSTALLGPYLQPCGTTPSTIAPGVPLTTDIAVPLQCGTCPVSHDGNENWDVQANWQLAPGQNLGAGFHIVVVTPPEPATTTTTTSATTTTTTTTTTSEQSTTTTSTSTTGSIP
jgi:hypothetical protein